MDIILLKVIFSIVFSPIFDQLPIFDWPPIPIFPKFAYQYICQYVDKVFWLKLVWIVFHPNLPQPN